MQACEKIARGFLVARGDGPKMVDCIEEPLDEVALGIERAKSQSRLILRFDLGGMTGLMARTFRLSTKLSGHIPCWRGGLWAPQEPRALRPVRCREPARRRG